MNSSLIEASSPRGGPTISSKKRRRNNMSKSTEERIRHISFRAASTAIIVLATSTAVRRSNGFGSPLSVHRSASCLHLSRRKKKLSSYGRGFGKDDVSKSKAIQDLSTILPSDGSGDEILDDDMSSLNEQSRSTFKNTRKRMNNSSGETQRDSSKVSSSLLPPTMKSGSKDQDSNPTDTQANDLSSWEDFFGSMSPGRSGENYREKNDIEKTNSLKNKKKQGNRSRSAHTSNSAGDGVSSSSNIDRKDLLPSIADLFPSNYTGSNLEATRREGSSSNKSENLKDNIFPSSSPTLEGVMPVSDLFYRSVQTVGDGGQNDNDKEGVHSNGRDDEELPFSAEQSNQLSTSQNKIKIRRNQVKSQKFGSSTSTKNNSDLGTTNRKKPRKNKKLQRRGMEMLVGGVPINADPPQRSIELTYDYDKNVDWKDVIATNTRDFGPMYYRPSVGKLLEEEKGLYCEFFVNSTLKWNVCPKDLRDITLNKNEDVLTEEDTLDNLDKNEVDDFQSIEMKGDLSGNSTEKTMKEALRRRMAGSMKEAFRKAANMADDKNKPFSVNANAELSGELVFSIGVSKDDLESSGGSESAKAVLKRVLATGISTSSQCKGFDVKFSKLQLSDLGDGTTSIAAAFVLTIENNTSMSFAEVKKKNNEINSSLAQAMDDGDMQLAMAAAAKREKAWSNDFRNRIVEEFLFDNDDGDEPLDDENPKKEPDLESTIDSLLKDLNYEVQGFKKDRADVPFGMPGSPVYSKDDLFLGGGNDGVFWNYAAENAMGAPYEGKLGLRMVDAVTERAKHRHPRVIAIGDVHGCIDELQDLLRECDYRPGDLVVFLGDLVSKGPDSFAVVQMAREIGAIGVRGNHDFEVVRWHQAIKSGVDPPVVGSEHFHIANCLTKADMKWMYSLPWYISSPDLGALFVHAGFVSGIRLAKQNPRLMMNMRSILPDGTVTSKFFNNWPWARLWDGPQTVLFGHDADRGLQQYEHAIGLDTGCVYGGRLTACILPEKRLVSVNARRQYFKYRRKHYD